jgi:hypothetical protein
MLPRAALAAALLFSASAGVAEKPRNVAITSDSKKGALLFRVETRQTPYTLVFTKDGKSNWLSSGYRIEVKGSFDKPAERYLVQTFEPGEYRLNAIHQQQNWGACLEDRTISIRITPGRIHYLGHFEAGTTLASIQRNAIRGKQMSARTHQMNMYFENVDPPILSGREAADRAAAETFVRSEMPKSSASVELANIAWVNFATPAGHSNLGHCG